MKPHLLLIVLCLLFFTISHAAEDSWFHRITKAVSKKKEKSKSEHTHKEHKHKHKNKSGNRPARSPTTSKGKGKGKSKITAPSKTKEDDDNATTEPYTSENQTMTPIEANLIDSNKNLDSNYQASRENSLNKSAKRRVVSTSARVDTFIAQFRDIRM